MEGSNSLKTTVLRAEMGYLCEELGDPVRYIPSLRSKDLLDQKDTDLIRSQVTSFQKTQHLMEILLRRRGDMSEHPLDILTTELKKQKVQVHIARRLQRTLKKKLKESQSETDGPVDGYDQQPHRTSNSYQRQPSSSHSSSVSVDTPSPQSVHSAQPQYDINPNVGPIPNAPPPTTISYPQSSDDYIDPEHGQCPDTPPPSSSLYAQDNGSLVSSTPPHPPHHTLKSGMQYMSLNNHMYNGGDSSETGGQSTRNSYPSLLSDSSYPSYSTESSDVEKEKLLATIEELSQMLNEEKRKNVQLTRELMNAKQEVVFSRQELAASRSKAIQSGDTNGGRQPESVVRPGTLFPVHEQQRHYRHMSPARAEAKYSTSSQGDNLSMRSANSSTSVNSNSSLNNVSRTQLHSYV